MSYLASTITNLAISINGKKGAKMTSVKDFLLDWDASKPRGTQSPEEMLNIFKSLAAGANRKDKKNLRDNKRIPASLQRKAALQEIKKKK